jgi:hypothetical protein
MGSSCERLQPEMKDVPCGGYVAVRHVLIAGRYPP